jgi:hypothetical protein
MVDGLISRKIAVSPSWRSWTSNTPEHEAEKLFRGKNLPNVGCPLPQIDDRSQTPRVAAGHGWIISRAHKDEALPISLAVKRD